MVLAPVGLAVVLTIASILAVAGWQRVRGLAVEMPTRAHLQLVGVVSYIVGSWIDVAVVWLWSSRCGIRRDVFAFRGLTWPAIAASLVGFAVAMVSVPVA